MKILTGILLVLLSHALDFGFASPARDGGRIVGGFPIPLSAAPYQISLLYRGYHQCGGTTGVPASYLSVRVGSGELGKGGDVIQVDEIINHPSFDKHLYDFDYALLKLEHSIEMDGISKAIIELPPANDPIEDSTRVFISGWGATEDTNASNMLRAAVVLTINQGKCDKAYYWDGGISNRMICAGSSGKDSCNGDSGGPMRREMDGVLIGIVSFGMSCADSYYPGVYSRVAAVRPWIKENSGV